MSNPSPPYMEQESQSSINAYPKAVARRLEELRRLILETARETPGVGSVEERLRWGQPSFLTSQTGSGSTIRIDGFKNDPEKFAMGSLMRGGDLRTGYLAVRRLDVFFRR